MIQGIQIYTNERFIKFLINAGYNNLNIFDPMVPSNEIINSSNLKIHNNWQDCINDSYCCILELGIRL